MRKLMMGLKVGLLVVGLLALVATPAMAQFADPLTLASSGVLIPYFGTGNNISLLEVASPVSSNPFLHFIFYNAFCTRVISFPTEQTTNDVDIYRAASNAAGSIVVGHDGLVAIADDIGNGFDLAPLTSPIHSRMYWINVADDRYRVLEPIIIDAFEVGGATTWSPIRTGATFFAPIDSPTGIQTTLYLICPRNTIQGATGPVPSAFPSSLFPVPLNPSTSSTFNASYPDGSLRALIYDDDEGFLTDWSTDCNCLQTKALAALPNGVNAVYASQDTYTEIQTDGSFAGFTGYKAITFAGIRSVDLFGRLSNANRLSLQGNFPGAPGGCGGFCR
jgi:hypothetical protein